MSLETWKQEFYPVEAETATGSELEATLHSLRKWLGLRKSNLTKHGLIAMHNSGYIIESSDNHEFGIDRISCALCKRHIGPDGLGCTPCVLFQIGSACGTKESPYQVWGATGDVRPMIAALRRAVKKLHSEEKQPEGFR
jgi:hypothetical protein